MRIDGSEVRPDYERTIEVVPGETYYLEVRSHDYYWSEQGREEVVRLRVEFAAQQFLEPRSALDQAVVSELGEEVVLRLMPRADRDVFAFTSPGSGERKSDLKGKSVDPGGRRSITKKNAYEDRPDY